MEECTSVERRHLNLLVGKFSLSRSNSPLVWVLRGILSWSYRVVLCGFTYTTLKSQIYWWPSCITVQQFHRSLQICDLEKDSDVFRGVTSQSQILIIQACNVPTVFKRRRQTLLLLKEGEGEKEKLIVVKKMKLTKSMKEFSENVKLLRLHSQARSNAAGRLVLGVESWPGVTQVVKLKDHWHHQQMFSGYL